MNVTIQDIRFAIQDLRLSGRPLCVHASLRSFGWVEGGAQAIVDGLLADGCSVMVPAFSWAFAVPPPEDMRPARNGWDYDAYVGPTAGLGRVYSPEAMDIDRDMGAIPAAIMDMPRRVRGNHPICSFCAVGPLAARLVSEQGPLNVYAPFRALAEAAGTVVLMGVGFDKMTLLHCAEQMAGRTMFRRWANGPDGREMQVEAGGCSGGFSRLEPVLSSLERRTTVGRSLWRVFPAREALDAAARTIRENPEMVHCDNSRCGRCNDAAAGGPLV